MNEWDFDESFSKKLQGLQSPDFSGEDWQNLSLRLENHQHRRNRILPLWWLGLLTGLLLVSNVFWWIMWKHTTTYSSTPGATATIVLHDTIVHQTHIYQYDTIYKITTLSSYAMNSVPQVSSLRPLDNSVAGIDSLQNSPQSNISAIIHPNNQAFYTFPGALPDTAFTRSLVSAPMLLPFEPAGPLVIPVRKEMLPAGDDLPPFIQPVNRSRPFIPKACMVTARGRTLKPKTNGMLSKGGLGEGLGMEVLFPGNWSIRAGFDYWAFRFKQYSNDGSSGLPVVHPPNSDYSFAHFETHDSSKPVYLFSSGLQYSVFGKAPVQILLGAGVQAQFHPEYGLEAEFINQSNGFEHSYYVEVEELKSPIFYGDIDLGLQFKLSKRWLGAATWTTSRKLNLERMGISSYSGLMATLKYKL